MAKEKLEKIVRTSDGIQFSVETDEPYVSMRGDVGELVRTEENFTEAISGIIESLARGLRRSQVDKAGITFGLALSPGGAFFLTKGQTESHLIVTLEFNRAAGSSYEVS